MILTEEQRAALKRVVAYMDEMYAIASPYHGCTEDANTLRAMIDGSGTVEPVGGFDLEKARAMICHYRIENPGDADTDCGLEDLIRQANLAEEALDEIERLRAALDESEQILAHKTKTATHWYEEGLKTGADLVQCKRVVEQQATRIKELKADLEQSEWSRRLRLDVIDQRAARIKELEADNQNLVTLNKSLMNNDWILRDNNRKYRKRAQKAELLNKELKSKIGPDADAKPHCWQITEERKAALDVILARIEYDQSLPGRFNYTVSRAKDTLRAMLEEAQP